MNTAKAERHEMIPEVGTKVMWPKTRDTAISYCRILLHDTLLKSDAFRTGISLSSVRGRLVVDTTVKLLNTSFYIVLKMTVSDHS